MAQGRFSFLQPGQDQNRAQTWAQKYDPQGNPEAGSRQLHETDLPFQTRSREAARRALQQGMSTANPEDMAAQEAIRSAFGERLQGLQGGMATRKGQLESELAQGFKNQVSELRRQAGGTGTMGSSTMGAQVGDIASQYQQNRANALIDLEKQGLGELGAIQSGLGDVYGQDLKERTFQLGQSKDFANLLMQQIAQDLAREQGLGAMRQADEASQRQFWSDLFGSAAGAGGRMAAGG
jgi:hypothetical protein